MANLWQQTIDGNHYEVRTAGASVRLYRNGVNHSQWHAAMYFSSFNTGRTVTMFGVKTAPMNRADDWGFSPLRFQRR